MATLGASQLRWRKIGKATTTRAQAAPASLPSPLVVVEGLTKKFGPFVAVDGLSWKTRRGEAIALWGKNGAGKTTAIKCILGLYRCKGRIVIADVDASRHGKRARATIGYVPQELALPADMGTMEALAFYARLKKVPSSRVSEALREVEMLQHGKKKIGQLSGGMKQRIALAVALLSDPPLLVLDEMTPNLDAAARADFLGLLVRQKKLGKSILFTSHRPAEIAALADRVLVLEQGRLTHECSPAELISLWDRED
jgi:ABC-type multidrug transport system ATPase subunit